MKQLAVLVVLCMVVLGPTAVKSSLSELHDIALTNASLSMSQIFAGRNVQVEVTAKNQGDSPEKFNITVFVLGPPDAISVDTYEVGSLSQSDQIVVSFVWNTEGIARGNYTIVANASVVEGEVEIANNGITAGNVTVLVDQTSPVIGVPVQYPPGSEVPASSVEVYVNVSDSQTGIDIVLLSWRVNNETTWQNATMVYSTSVSSYYSWIDVYQEGTFVSYRIVATDKAGNTQIRDNGGNYYTYSTVIPEYQPSFLALLSIFAAVAIVIVQKKRLATKKRQSRISRFFKLRK